MSAALFAHDGVTHTTGESALILISMIAFSLFLLAFAWALLRPSRPAKSTSADVAAERFAHGEIDADDFARIVRHVKSRQT